MIIEFNVYQSFFTLNILFNDLDRGLGHVKKILDTTSIVFFFLKTVRDDLK